MMVIKLNAIHNGFSLGVMDSLPITRICKVSFALSINLNYLMM